MCHDCKICSKMIEFCDKNIKYIIPFDSLDLSLLPSLNVLPRLQENVMPIWDTNNLLLRNEDCYYEFEIEPYEDSIEEDTFCSCKVDSPDMETDTQDPKPPMHMCYICNMDVPAVCMSEHLAGAKHNTFLKIADISLERVKKHMATNYKSENLPVGFSFCDTCTNLIPDGDLVSHMKLKSHKNAVIVDKLLSDLLKIYSESEVADEDESANWSQLETPKTSTGDSYSPPKRKVVNIGVACSRKFSTSEVVNSSSKSNGFASKTTTDGDKLAVEAAKITKSRIKLDIDAAKDTARCDKLDADVAKYNSGRDKLDKFITVNGDSDAYTARVTPNGGKLDTGVAKADDANGEQKRDEISNETDVYDDLSHNDAVDGMCKEVTQTSMPYQPDLCKLLISKMNGGLNDYVHLIANGNYKVEVGEENDLVVEVPSGPRVRVTLANFHGLYALGKHMLCYLCKTIEKDLKLHIYSAEHLVNIRRPIDQNYARELDSEKSHCIICNDVIDCSAVHTLCNKNHDTRLKLALVDEEEGRSENSAWSTQQASTTEKIQVDNVSIKSEGTANGPVTLLYSEAAKAQDHVDKICKICHLSYHPADWETHSQSSEHKTNEFVIPQHLVEYSITSRTLKCLVCDTSFPVHSKIQHLSSLLHQNNYKKLLEDNNMTRVGRNLYCSKCVTCIMFGDELVHINSLKHKSFMTNSIATCVLVKQEVKEEGPINPHYCKVCLLNVPGDAKSQNLHVEGARHKKNLALLEDKKDEKNGKKGQSPVSLFAYGHVIRVNGNSEVECRICLTIVPYTTRNIREHLDGSNHRSKASLLEKSSIKLYRDIYWCSICKLQVLTSELLMHTSNSSHAEKAKDKEGTDEEKSTSKDSNSIDAFYLNMLKPTENKGTLCCQVCNVMVPNSGTPLRMHFDGVRHRSRQMMLLKSNGLREMGLKGEFDCTICWCRFPSNNLLDHIDGPRHVASLGSSLTPADGKSQQEAGGKPKIGQWVRESDAKSNSGQQVLEPDAKSNSGQQVQEPDAKSTFSQWVKEFDAKSKLNQKYQESGLKSKLEQKDHESDGKLKSGQQVQESDAKLKSGQQAQKSDAKSKPAMEEEAEKSTLSQNGDKASIEPESFDHAIFKNKDFLCVLCDVFLTNNETNITLHNRGARHKTILRRIQQNKIRVLDGAFFCDVCDMKFASDQLSTHLTGSQHLVMLG